MNGNRGFYKTISALLMIGLLFLNANSNGQRNFNWRDRVDKLVEEIDSLSMKSQIIFYSNNYLQNNDPVRETWFYTVKDGKVAIFQIRYYIQGNEFHESYYLDKGELICMEKYETVNLSSYDDAIKEGEVFYFVGRSLMQYISLGKDSGRMTNWERQNNSLKKFEERYAELRRNLAMK